jgi:hypothetical protein
MATPALAICSILEFLYLPTLPPLGSLEAAKNQIPVPEKTVTAAFAYKLFTTLTPHGLEVPNSTSQH